MSNVAADAAVRVSLEGMAELSAELRQMKSELLSAVGTNTKVAAVSAIKDGFDMVSGSLSRAYDALGMFFKGVTDASERVANMQKIADRLGTTVKFISQMRVASITSNMSLDEFEQSMAAFQRNLDTFSQGVGESKQTLEGLGITPDMILGWGGLENQMKNIILRLAQIDDPSKRAGAAMRIFGEQGRKLIPIVNADVKALQALMDISDFLGASISETFGRDADRYRDSVRHLTLAIEGLWNQLSSSSLPLINTTLENLIVSIKTFTDLQGELGKVEEGFMGIADAAASAGKMILGLELYARKAQAGALGLETMALEFNFLGASGERAKEGQAMIDLARAKEIEASSQVTQLMELYRQFDDAFNSNLEKYRELREEATPGQDEMKVAAVAMAETASEVETASEKMKSAAEILADAFKGEAIGNTASDMSRLVEMNRQVFGDIRMYLQRIDRGLEISPVVRTVR